jgi:copper transport protein
VPGHPLELEVGLGSLPKGVYTVTWRVVSRADGHVTANSFSFGVGESPAGHEPPGGTVLPTTPAPSPAAVAGRWAFYWGLALIMGAGVAGSVAFGGLPMVRGARALLAGAWGLALVGLVLMALAERSTVGVSLGTLLNSQAGREFVYRAIALGVVGVGVVQALLSPRWTSLVPLAVATAVALFVHALAGHAGAETRAVSRWFDTSVQALHLIAVGVWVGGLAWLLLAIRGTEGQERARAVTRYSWLAGIALAGVAVTGTLRAIDEVGRVRVIHALFHTSFGITLLVKVALFGGLVALGMRNRYVNVPGVASGARPPRSLARTVRLELALAAAIFAATGVLSELPPATVVEAAATKAPPPAHVVVAGSDFATSVKVRLTVTPGTVGPNTFAARVTDFDSGRPVDASALTLRFRLASRPELGEPMLALAREPDGTWSGTGTVIAFDGTWDVSVLVQQPSGAVEVPLTFTPALPKEQITVSTAPGQPTVFTIALPDGSSVQTYVDPGTPGNDTVHFTFFKASGSEQPIATATATETAPSGEARDLSLIRFDPGHFAANTALTAGRWRFTITATARDGSVYHAYFDQRIPG